MKKKDLNSSSDSPLVSVIIPCFNHGNLLSEAIESVKRQTYSSIEIIVVDDGSTDNTKEVAKSYSGIKYFYQENKGLSSARNLGILKSTGELMVFLDADDLLLNYSIHYNVKYFQKNKSLAFVSGAYQATTLDNRILGEKKEIVINDHYINFLKSNYIGMLAAVMFKRVVFDEFNFDISLKYCEDYDIYLKVTRKYPVAHHTRILTSYRMHDSNMSNNNALMLKYGLEVLSRQEALLKNNEERKAYMKGIKNMKTFYITRYFLQLFKKEKKNSKEILKGFKNYNFLLHFRISNTHYFKKYNLKRFVPEFGLRLLHKLRLYKAYVPSFQSVKLGDFIRTSPFSRSFGNDRGGAIDRYYIEKFLEEESKSVRGRVLEIGDNEYTLRFGQKRVQKSEILHVNDSNPQATIIGDLSDAPQIPDSSFDCIILTQTLHLVFDYQSVIQTCYRILKPGGTLLLTVPGISPIDYGEWGESWYWSFTGLSIEKILMRTFRADLIDIQTHGNVHVASTFLYGMGLPEIKKEALDYHDPQMQVIVTAKAVKE